MKNESLKLVSRPFIRKFWMIYLIASISEFVIQQSLFEDLFNWPPIILWTAELPKSFIAASGIFALAMVLSVLIKDKVKHRVFMKSKEGKLSLKVWVFVGLTLIIASSSGFLNAAIVLMRWNLAEMSFDLWIEVIIKVALTALSMALFLCSAISGAVLLTTSPIYRLRKERDKAQKRLDYALSRRAEIEKKTRETERLFSELDTIIAEMLKAKLLSVSGVGLGPFMDMFKSKGDEGK